jgi:hypothetical protein
LIPAGAPPVPDAAARQNRAVAVAAEFLRSQGYEVDQSPAAGLFPLTGRKGGRNVLVRVQSPAEGEPLRFTRDDLDEMAQHAEPSALIVVGKLAQPAAAGQPYTGGTVVKFVENWKAVRDQLVPVVFEFPLR